MIQFEKPTNLNGSELLDELKAVGITIESAPFIDANGNLWLDIKADDESKAASIVVVHNGTTVAPEPTAADKLAASGLTVEELKEILGL